MLIDILDQSEAVIQKYLEDHPDILQVSVGTANWYYNYVIPQFSLGSDGGKPDFVIVNGQSDSYWIHIVELKLPTVKRFTDSDMPSTELRNAVDQLMDYSMWITYNMPYFKEILRKKLKEDYSDFNETFQNNRRFIICKDLIIGRREDLNEKRQYYTSEIEESIRIISYDRLIDNEKRLAEMAQKNIDKYFFELDDEIRNDYGIELYNKYDD